MAKQVRVIYIGHPRLIKPRMAFPADSFPEAQNLAIG
jgi:hypothetical protein